jgi:hypothetical protein
MASTSVNPRPVHPARPTVSLGRLDFCPVARARSEPPKQCIDRARLAAAENLLLAMDITRRVAWHGERGAPVPCGRHQGRAGAGRGCVRSVATRTLPALRRPGTCCLAASSAAVLLGSQGNPRCNWRGASHRADGTPTGTNAKVGGRRARSKTAGRSGLGWKPCSKRQAALGVVKAWCRWSCRSG